VNWSNTLSNLKVASITVFWGPEVEARRFFQTLQKVGKRINVPVKAGMGQADGPDIELSAPKNTIVGPTLLMLFQKNGYRAKLTETEETERVVSIFIPDRS
jgi:hypothetical protein